MAPCGRPFYRPRAHPGRVREPAAAAGRRSPASTHCSGAVAPRTLGLGRRPSGGGGLGRRSASAERGGRSVGHDFRLPQRRGPGSPRGQPRPLHPGRSQRLPRGERKIDPGLEYGSRPGCPPRAIGQRRPPRPGMATKARHLGALLGTHVQRHFPTYGPGDFQWLRFRAPSNLHQRCPLPRQLLQRRGAARNRPPSPGSAQGILGAQSRRRRF